MKPFISAIVAVPLIAVAALAVAIKPIEALSDETNEDLFCEEDFANVTLCTKVTNEKLNDPCKDDNVQCSFWASEGECKINPNYMLQNCAKSCKECEAFLDPEDHDVLDMLNKRSDLNVEQERSYGRNKMEMKKTYDYSSRIDEYREALFQHPSTTSKTRKLCINELSKCTYYAAMGLCEQRVIFMLETCPLACMMCDKKEQFDQCVGMRHPFDVPVFVSQKEYDIISDDASSTNHKDIKQQVNTVDSFFLSKKDNSKWIEDHSAEFVNDPIEHKNGDSSWIVQLDNVISSAECQSIIDLGNKVGWEDSSTIPDTSFSVTKAEDETPKFAFKRARCHNTDIKCDDYAAISNVKKRLSELIGLGLEYFESSDLIHFPEAKGYQSLQHNYELHDVWKIVGPRVLSFYIPLSTTEAGGYMGFPSLEWLMIQPRVGQVTILSNVLNSDPNVMNDKMAHEVLPVQKGELYVLRIHVRQFDYESAKSRGYEHCV